MPVRNKKDDNHITKKYSVTELNSTQRIANHRAVPVLVAHVYSNLIRLNVWQRLDTCLTLPLHHFDASHPERGVQSLPFALR